MKSPLEMLKTLRDAAVNTPALDSSSDWTALIEEADAVLGEAAANAQFDRDLRKECL